MSVAAKLWALAALGASLGWAGDVLCVLAFKRGGDQLLVLIAMFLFAACAPTWYAMTSLSRGSFSTPAFFWTASSAVLSVAAAALLDGSVGLRGWLSLGLVLAGILVRG